MRCQSICDFGFFVGFLFAQIVYTTPIENINHSNSYLISQKRQVIKYNPTTTSPLNVALASGLCTPLTSNKKENCTINVKKLGYDHALIIDPSDHTKFLYPNSNGTIILFPTQSLFLSCPGPNNTLKNVPDSPSSSNFSCVCGSVFATRLSIHEIGELGCKLAPKYEILDKGFYGRESEYRKFEVGFYTDDQKRFLRIIELHYDRSATSTMYAKSTVSMFIAGRQNSAKQRRFDQTHCCERQRSRLDMDVIYSAKTQDRSFAAQLYCHDSEFRTRCFYLNGSTSAIFKRGQLSPASSFVYSSAGSASYVYLNTGPQWRPISSGNWLRIEDHVPEMARELHRDLIVYTGVYDRLRLRDTGDANSDKMMFLYAGGQGDRSIAIPLYFWKIVYEPLSRRAVVFVTVNNLYVERVEEYQICEKPMFSRDGARMPRQWNPQNLAKGYSYTCEVNDFLRSSGIVISDFSATMVSGPLYLPRRSANRSAS